ncbi:hypothetical protein AMTR_s00065p00126320 [Amborella trichopoda]|uniref:Uncharacterized protein n=1 Tax=Amborella trichopoda TaxID=13333 RepID=U5DDV3_AMBTC|nr:hypothetical protein AMTR_s00065p00126320 [Amborella trichopoda]
MADLSPIHSWPRLVPPLRQQGLVSYSCSSYKRTATSLKAWFLPPSLELVHSLGDPLLSRSSVFSSFRPVSGISAHCSHLQASLHLDSTKTLVPRTACLKPALGTTTPNEPCDKMQTFPMLRFPLVHSQVGLGEHPSDCLRESKRALTRGTIRIGPVETS